MTDADKGKPDAQLILLLIDRDGMPTTVSLRDGRNLTVWNIAWGYDMGDEYAHVTTNCSPSVGDMPLDFFHTDEVVEVRAQDADVVLFDRQQ